MSFENSKKVMVLAVYAGEILLKNGAETYRVEDTISLLCRASGHEYVEAFVTPTGIFVSIDQEGDLDDHMVTYIKRITSRSINLEKISRVNDLSRRCVDGFLSIDEAMAELKQIDRTPGYPFWQKALMGAFGSALFAVLFGANVVEFFMALLASIMVSTVTTKMEEVSFPPFVCYMAGGATAGILAVLTSSLIPLVELDKVIVGAVIVLVPGVAVTNAIRDSIAGDLISGMAKGAEALIIATSIAIGVGAVLKTWLLMTGGGF